MTDPIKKLNTVTYPGTDGLTLSIVAQLNLIINKVNELVEQQNAADKKQDSLVLKLLLK